MEDTSYGWRAAAPGGRWREFKTQGETGDRRIGWGHTTSGPRSRLQVQVRVRVRVRVRESGPGSAPEPEHLNLIPDGRDLGPENISPPHPFRFPVSL